MFIFQFIQISLLILILYNPFINFHLKDRFSYTQFDYINCLMVSLKILDQTIQISHLCLLRQIPSFLIYNRRSFLMYNVYNVTDEKISFHESTTPFFWVKTITKSQRLFSNEVKNHDPITIIVFYIVSLDFDRVLKP